MKSKTVIISLVLLFVLLSFVLTGCGPGPGPGPNGPPPPAPCSLRLISRAVDVWGTVYINGQPQGTIVGFGDSITIPGMPCGGSVQLQIIGADGAWSQIRTVNLLSSGQTTVDLTNWPWLF